MFADNSLYVGKNVDIFSKFYFILEDLYKCMAMVLSLATEFTLSIRTSSLITTHPKI